VSIHPITYSKPGYIPNSFTDINAFLSHEKVFIGNDVWIGANCLIIDGVKIGDGAVIGANSVITKDVEPYLIVGGVPGKPIRKRFDDNTISKLLEFKWWNKDDAWIKQNVSKFWDINDFIDLMDP
jgi:acetyltransferase-like isoleucine patch superfamily enzyme